MSGVHGAGMDDAHDPLDLPRPSARVAHPGRWRVLAVVLALVAWALGAAAVALIPPWARPRDPDG